MHSSGVPVPLIYPWQVPTWTSVPPYPLVHCSDARAWNQDHSNRFATSHHQLLRHQGGYHFWRAPNLHWLYASTGPWRSRRSQSLDLNMGYYPIQIIEVPSYLCTIILPWGKYHYSSLATRISKSSDIFQQKINYLFQIYKFICAYIDNLLILTKYGWNNNA